MNEQDYENLRKCTLKKLNEVFKCGYFPSRGDEKYYAKGKIVNGFEHACFNLTNEQLKNFDYSDKLVFGFKYKPAWIAPSAEEELLRFVLDAGLDVEIASRDKKLLKNQWMVAMYLDTTSLFVQDVQFFLKEKDETWSAKVGFSKKITVTKNLATKSEDNRIELYNTYIITNPSTVKTIPRI